MIDKKFFGLESKDETFVVTLKVNFGEFRCGDVLICRKVENPLPGAIVILDRDYCRKWLMRFGEAGPELAAGARIVGQVLSMSRDLDGGVMK